MIAMQYKILLPENYDMNIIRKELLLMGTKQTDFRIYYLKLIL